MIREKKESAVPIQQEVVFLNSNKQSMIHENKQGAVTIQPAIVFHNSNALYESRK